MNILDTVIEEVFCHVSRRDKLQPTKQDFSRFLKISPIVETETEMTKAQFVIEGFCGAKTDSEIGAKYSFSETAGKGGKDVVSAPTRG